MDGKGLLAGQLQGRSALCSLCRAVPQCSTPAAAARCHAWPRTTKACNFLRAPRWLKAYIIDSTPAAARDDSLTLQLQAYQAITTSTV